MRKVVDSELGVDVVSDGAIRIIDRDSVLTGEDVFSGDERSKNYQYSSGEKRRKITYQGTGNKGNGSRVNSQNSNTSSGESDKSSSDASTASGSTYSGSSFGGNGSSGSYGSNLPAQFTPSQVTSGLGKSVEKSDKKESETDGDIDSAEEIDHAMGQKPRVSVEENKVYVQHFRKSTVDGEDGVWEDSGYSFDIQRMYNHEDCRDVIDYTVGDLGTAYATYRKYYVDISGEVEFVNAVLYEDRESPYPLKYDSVGCDVVVDTVSSMVTPRVNLIYYNRDKGRVIVKPSFIPDGADSYNIVEKEVGYDHRIKENTSYRKVRDVYNIGSQEFEIRSRPVRIVVGEPIVHKFMQNGFAPQRRGDRLIPMGRRYIDTKQGQLFLRDKPEPLAEANLLFRISLDSSRQFIIDRDNKKATPIGDYYYQDEYGRDVDFQENVVGKAQLDFKYRLVEYVPHDSEKRANAIYDIYVEYDGKEYQLFNNVEGDDLAPVDYRLVERDRQIDNPDIDSRFAEGDWWCIPQNKYNVYLRPDDTEYLEFVASDGYRKDYQLSKKHKLKHRIVKECTELNHTTGLATLLGIPYVELSTGIHDISKIPERINPSRNYGFEVSRFEVNDDQSSAKVYGRYFVVGLGERDYISSDDELYYRDVVVELKATGEYKNDWGDINTAGYSYPIYVVNAVFNIQDQQRLFVDSLVINDSYRGVNGEEHTKHEETIDIVDEKAGSKSGAELVHHKRVVTWTASDGETRDFSETLESSARLIDDLSSRYTPFIKLEDICLERSVINFTDMKIKLFGRRKVKVPQRDGGYEEHYIDKEICDLGYKTGLIFRPSSANNFDVRWSDEHVLMRGIYYINIDGKTRSVTGVVDYHKYLPMVFSNGSWQDIFAENYTDEGYAVEVGDYGLLYGSAEPIIIASHYANSANPLRIKKHTVVDGGYVASPDGRSFQDGVVVTPQVRRKLFTSPATGIQKPVDDTHVITSSSAIKLEYDYSRTNVTTGEIFAREYFVEGGERKYRFDDKYKSVDRGLVRFVQQKLGDIADGKVSVFGYHEVNHKGNWHRVNSEIVEHSTKLVVSRDVVSWDDRPNSSVKDSGKSVPMIQLRVIDFDGKTHDIGRPFIDEQAVKVHTVHSDTGIILDYDKAKLENSTFVIPRKQTVIWQRSDGSKVFAPCVEHYEPERRAVSVKYDLSKSEVIINETQQVVKLIGKRYTGDIHSPQYIDDQLKFIKTVSLEFKLTGWENVNDVNKIYPVGEYQVRLDDGKDYTVSEGKYHRLLDVDVSTAKDTSGKELYHHEFSESVSVAGYSNPYQKRVVIFNGVSHTVDEKRLNRSIKVAHVKVLDEIIPNSGKAPYMEDIFLITPQLRKVVWQAENQATKEVFTAVDSKREDKRVYVSHSEVRREYRFLYNFSQTGSNYTDSGIETITKNNSEWHLSGINWLREFNLESKYNSHRCSHQIIQGNIEYRQITQTFKLTMVDGVEKAREFIKEDSTNWSLYAEVSACKKTHKEPWIGAVK